ncbi:Nucleotide-binding universal stress protein, UspA family [Psychrobacillus sp. OK028]|uniref:universal stress protein n=1 Tax=Psychrobacillus sp. OK028 TaxID=1884359 RepID=UPI000886207E|nr:universal stress protein [Psychrobacillus sp. OK028]SDN10039.1 Nucleotide-binding universal stress protein, UspA family [Psychrobacillus sp. OK028]
MYPHILLAADGSENSVRAANEAIKLAKCSPSSIIEVVMVTDFEKSKQDILHAQSAESLLLERKRKISNVELLLTTEKVNYKITFLKGSPGSEIVRYANEQKADLVVIGSRGLNGLQEMVLGSVSHKVMKRVHCAALIVK